MAKRLQSNYGTAQSKEQHKGQTLHSHQEAQNISEKFRRNFQAALQERELREGLHSSAMNCLKISPSLMTEKRKEVKLQEKLISNKLAVITLISVLLINSEQLLGQY